MTINELMLDEKQKKWLDNFIAYAVGEGALEADQAAKMSYEDKFNYFVKCEVQENEKK